MCSQLLQVERFNTKGVCAVCVTGESNEDTTIRVEQEEFQVVYFTPETLITKRCWRNLLTNDLYSSRLKGFVVDEAHCVKKWYV